MEPVFLQLMVTLTRASQPMRPRQNTFKIGWPMPPILPKVSTSTFNTHSLAAPFELYSTQSGEVFYPRSKCDSNVQYLSTPQIFYYSSQSLTLLEAWNLPYTHSKAVPKHRTDFSNDNCSPCIPPRPPPPPQGIVADRSLLNDSLSERITTQPCSNNQ